MRHPRILDTLRRGGWISRDKQTKKFKLPLSYRTYRIGYAQRCAGEPFSDAVTRGLVGAAERSLVDLLVTDNHHDAEEAIKNAEWMIKQKVDFAIEYQGRQLQVPGLRLRLANRRQSVIHECAYFATMASDG